MQHALTVAAVTINRVTSEPGHHYFGYYDKTPWDPGGRYLLALRTALADRVPQPSDRAELGVIDLRDGCRFEALTKTGAFSWQMGAMQQWLPSGRTVLYNDRRAGRLVAVLLDLDSGQQRELPRAVAALSHDASFALSLSFERLADVRPETGYAGVTDPYRGVDAPEQDGIHRMDLDTGAVELILSLAQIAALEPRSEMTGGPNWVNHLTLSPDDAQIVFVHRWWPAGASRFQTRLCAAGADGRGLRVIWPGIASHFAWRNPRELLFSGNYRERPSGADRRFFLMDVTTGDVREFGTGVLPSDGHCSLRPGGGWILNDSYPDEARLQCLHLVREWDLCRIELGRFYAPPEVTGQVRCDLHPRWNRDGTQVCIDSAHEGSRQMYVLDVRAVVDLA